MKTTDGLPVSVARRCLEPVTCAVLARPPMPLMVGPSAWNLYIPLTPPYHSASWSDHRPEDVTDGQIPERARFH